jgi:hypothetical protein
MTAHDGGRLAGSGTTRLYKVYISSVRDSRNTRYSCFYMILKRIYYITFPWLSGQPNRTASPEARWAHHTLGEGGYWIPHRTHVRMDAQKIRLVNGPYDGQVVEADPRAEVLWVYKNMYNTLVSVRAGGMHRTDSMQSYVVIPSRGEAQHGIA